MARQLMSPKTIRACTVVWKIISGRCVRGPRDLDDADPHPRGAGLRRALHEAGVPLPAGTDATPFAPGHGDGRHRELKLLTRAGLTPLEALTASTATVARHFSLAGRGRIAPDLLLVSGDPTRDIHAVRRRGVRRIR
ncbi:hypothetical protein [Streptomyces clavuligerus]|uniref:hypothetical protein n=1 Tax=Streptomyces clavuligerus TaxID=1901 RepID=UPI0018CB8E3D